MTGRWAAAAAARKIGYLASTTTATWPCCAGGGESGAKNPTNPIKILDAAGIRVIARPGKSECSRVFFTAEKDVALEGNKKAVGGFLGGELHSGWNLITVALSGGEGAEGGKLQGTLNGRVAGVVKQEVRAFLSLFFHWFRTKPPRICLLSAPSLFSTF